MQLYKLKGSISQENYKYTEFKLYPSEAISAGIATAIRPTAAVAASNDVLTVC